MSGDPRGTRARLRGLPGALQPLELDAVLGIPHAGAFPRGPACVCRRRRPRQPRCRLAPGRSARPEHAASTASPVAKVHASPGGGAPSATAAAWTSARRVSRLASRIPVPMPVLELDDEDGVGEHAVHVAGTGGHQPLTAHHILTHSTEKKLQQVLDLTRPTRPCAGISAQIRSPHGMPV